mmetsp:Transcript_139517/g.242713  ORF Transcript_139517/g.242713 Transcript_139517/m.242713 type:complete len:232 (+) Transcript_139517:3780-4475(+)
MGGNYRMVHNVPDAGCALHVGGSLPDQVLDLGPHDRRPGLARLRVGRQDLVGGAHPQLGLCVARGGRGQHEERLGDVRRLTGDPCLLLLQVGGLRLGYRGRFPCLPNQIRNKASHLGVEADVGTPLGADQGVDVAVPCGRLAAVLIHGSPQVVVEHPNPALNVLPTLVAGLEDPQLGREGPRADCGQLLLPIGGAPAFQERAQGCAVRGGQVGLLVEACRKDGLQRVPQQL